MTVKELRDTLAELPDDTPVAIDCEVGGYDHEAEVLGLFGGTLFLITGRDIPDMTDEEVWLDEESSS